MPYPGPRPRTERRQEKRDRLTTLQYTGLKRAVAEALERKRRLGQYPVVWRDGRVVCTGPDAPVAPGKNE